MSFYHSHAVANIGAGYIHIAMQYILCAKSSVALHHQQTREEMTAKNPN
jgi:hypothetical protein